MDRENINDIAFKSKIKISDALFRKLQNEKYEGVAIIHLCEEAGVASKTYYRNFSSKDEIVAFYYDRLVSGFTEVCSKDSLDVHSLLSRCFDYFTRYQGTLKATEYNGFWYKLRARIAEGLRDFRCMEDIDSLEKGEEPAACVAGVISSILRLWTDHDFRESTEKLVALADIMLSKDK